MELMKYFLDSNGDSDKFPKLEKRVDYFKNVKEGAGEMSEFKDKIMKYATLHKGTVLQQ